MPRRFTRFDNIEFPAYEYKPYPRLITVGEGKSKRRLTVQSEEEEQAAFKQFGGTPEPRNAPAPSAPGSTMAAVNQAQAEQIKSLKDANEAMQQQLTDMANMVKALQAGKKETAEPTQVSPQPEGGEASAKPAGEMAHLSPAKSGKLKLG